jgi:hypothetical protein
LGLLRPDDLVGTVITLDGAGAAPAAMDRPASAAGLTAIEI